MHEILRRKRIQIEEDSLVQVSSKEYYAGRATSKFRSSKHKMVIDEFENGSSMITLLDHTTPFGLHITCRGDSVVEAFYMLNGALEARHQTRAQCAG